MKFSGTGVGVIHAMDAVFVAHERVELADVGGQVLDGDRGVLDDLARFRVALDDIHQALPGPAEIPHAVAILTPKHGEGITESGTAETGFDGLHLALDPGAVFMTDLDDKHGTGIALARRSGFSHG